MVDVAKQQRHLFAVARRGGGGRQRLIESLAVGNAGQGIGHAFLAHIRELGPEFIDLLRGDLQFAFQALGAHLHGAGGGDQAIHQLAQVGGAAVSPPSSPVAADSVSL